MKFKQALDVNKVILHLLQVGRKKTEKQMYKDEFESLSDRGYELITRLPQFGNIKTSLYSQQRKHHEIQREPTRSNEVIFDEEILRMSDGKSFLMADCGERQRIVIFASSLGKQIMNTFRSSSKQSAQLYTIHVDLGSSHKETNVTPAVFVLLANKKSETYMKMFEMILHEIPDWRPETVITDFETATLYALRQVFPAA